MKIFSYDWEDIKRAQQGGRLSPRLPLKRTGSMLCTSCGKYFPNPDSFPAKCNHCGKENNKEQL